MSLPVVLREEAQAEFDEAFDFYEGRKQGLGITFVARIQEVLERRARTRNANPLSSPMFARRS